MAKFLIILILFGFCSFYLGFISVPREPLPGVRHDKEIPHDNISLRKPSEVLNTSILSVRGTRLERRMPRALELALSQAIEFASLSEDQSIELRILSNSFWEDVKRAEQIAATVEKVGDRRTIKLPPNPSIAERFHEFHAMATSLLGDEKVFPFIQTTLKEFKLWSGDMGRNPRTIQISREGEDFKISLEEEKQHPDRNQLEQPFRRVFLGPVVPVQFDHLTNL